MQILRKFLVPTSGKSLLQVVGLIVVAVAIFSVPPLTHAAAPARQIPVTARILNPDTNTPVPDGSYTIRFSIYSVNRTTSDPYPSDSDIGKRVWSETKSLDVKNGFASTMLGSDTLFPDTIDFTSNDLYLGIRIGTDPELVPRRQLGSVPNAIDSDQLQGKQLGFGANSVPYTNSNGVLALTNGLSVSNGATFSGGINNSNGGIINAGAITGVTTFNASGTIASSATSAALQATGTPVAAGNASLLQLGSTITNGSSLGNYLGINTADSFKGDLLDIEKGDSSLLTLNGTGLLNLSRDTTISSNQDWGQVNSFNTSTPSINNLGTPAMVTFGSYLYAGTYTSSTGGQIWRTSDGTSWSQVNTSGFGTSNNTTIQSLVVFGGNLYAGTVNTADGAEVWSSSNGTSWSQVNTSGFGSADNQSIAKLIVFNSVLYAGTVNTADGAEVWSSSNGTSWSQVNTSGFGDVNNDSISGATVFGSDLYVGTGVATAGGQIWRTSDGTSWSQVNTSGFGDADNAGIVGLGIFSGKIYAGTNNVVDGGEIWSSSNGTSWSQVNTSGFGDVNNTAIDNFTTFGANLYVTTETIGTGAQIWRTSDGTSWSQVNTSGFGDVNNWGVFASLAVFNTKLYMSVSNLAGTEVWNSSDGTTWTQANTNNFFTPVSNENTAHMVAVDPLYFDNQFTIVGQEASGSGDYNISGTLDGTSFNDENGNITGSGDIASRVLFDGAEFVSTTGSGGTKIFKKTHNTDSGVQTNAGGFGDSNNISSQLFVYKGLLFAGTTNSSEGAQLWSSPDGTSWTQVTVGWSADNTAITSFVLYQGSIFLGTTNTADGAEIWSSSDGASWGSFATNGIDDPNNTAITAMQVYKNNLIAATENAISGTKIYLLTGGSTQVNTSGFGSSRNTATSALYVFNNKIYAGTTNTTDGGELWSNDSSTWTRVNTNGFGDSNNTAISSLFGFKGYLYAGTDNSNGTELWRLQTGIISSDTGSLIVQSAQIGDIAINNDSIEGVNDLSVSTVSAAAGNFDTLYVNGQVITGSAGDNALLDASSQTFTGANTFSQSGTALVVNNAASIGSASIGSLTVSGSSTALVVTNNATVGSLTVNTNASVTGTLQGASLGLNVTAPSNAGELALQNANSTSVAVTIKGASGQSADLLQVQDSGGNALAKIDSNGNLLFDGNRAAIIQDGTTGNPYSNQSENITLQSQYFGNVILQQGGSSSTTLTWNGTGLTWGTNAPSATIINVPTGGNDQDTIQIAHTTVKILGGTWNFDNTNLSNNTNLLLSTGTLYAGDFGNYGVVLPATQPATSGTTFYPSNMVGLQSSYYTGSSNYDYLSALQEGQGELLLNLSDTVPGNNNIGSNDKVIHFTQAGNLVFDSSHGYSQVGDVSNVSSNNTPLTFNGYTGSTTGGVQFLGGGSSPALQASISGAGVGYLASKLSVGVLPGSANGTLDVRQDAVGDLALYIKGIASATANEIEVDDSSGNLLFAVDTTGHLVNGQSLPGVPIVGVDPNSGTTAGDLTSTSGPLKPSAGSGLTLNIAAGSAYTANAVSSQTKIARCNLASGTTLAMTDNTTNYVYVTTSGAASTTGITCAFSKQTTVPVFSASKPVLVIAKVITSGGSITSVADTRFFIGGSFNYINTAAGTDPGTIVINDTSADNQVKTTTSATAAGVSGVVVVGNTAAGKAILMTSGQAWTQTISTATRAACGGTTTTAGAVSNVTAAVNSCVGQIETAASSSILSVLINIHPN